jgi:hypothetical protein
LAICEKCGNEHDGTFGSGRFCSLHCQNSNPCTDETKKKLKTYWENKRQQHQQRLQNQFKVCEVCGKIFRLADVNKTSSGRFCSRSCANKRKHTESTKNKIKNTIKNTYRHKSKDHILNTDLEIRDCIVCGKSFQTIHKYRTKTCSKQCTNILIKQTKIKNGTLSRGGGYNVNSNKQYGGYYKGQWCDSRWELAFLIYHLDKGYNIEKCKEYFEYRVNNKIHKYYPDFKIDNVYYEIKGRWRQNLQHKLQIVKSKGFEIKVIMKKEIKPYLDYCFNAYGIKRLEELYDA